MAQKILTGLGAVEYVDVTVPRDQDDTGYQMAFGSSTAPGEWQTPDVIVDAGATMTLRLLVGNDHYNPVAGSYSLWWRKSTEPQRFVRDSSARVVIVTDNGSEVGIGVPWATVADLAETLAEANAYTDTHGGGGGGGAVSSVFGRSGVVVAQTGDYSAAQVGAASTAALAAEISRATSVEATKADLVGGVVPTAQIPALALTATVVVDSQAAMLALTTSQVQPGDIAVRTDGTGTFILTATNPSQISNWTRLNAPTDAVTTVNGQSGDVVLAASDVGAYVRPVDGIPSADLTAAVQAALDKSNGALQQSIGTAKGDLVGFSAAGTPVRVPAGGDGSFVAYDSTAASGLSAQAALTASSLTLGATNGALKKPWGGDAPVGAELWATPMMSSDSVNGVGGQNATVTPSVTADGTVHSTFTRFRVGYSLADGQVGEAFRFDFTINNSIVDGWSGLVLRARTATGALVPGTEVILYTSSDGAVTGYRSSIDWSYPALNSNGVRYIEIEQQALNNSSAGSLQITAASLRQVATARPGLNVSWGRPGFPLGSGEQVHCDIPVTDPVTGTTKYLRKTFGQDGALLFSPIALTYADGQYAHNYATQQGMSIANRATENTMAGSVRNLHANNNGQIMGVVKADNSTELRCNVHGGETGLTGTYTTDYVFEMDFGDGTWVPLADPAHTHSCRRFRVTAHCKISRSDAGTPFANSDLVFTIYDDGTMRFDRKLTFLADQKMFQWFYFMHSFDFTVLEQGRMGFGQQVIAGFDPRQHLTTPNPPTISQGTGGTYGAVTRNYRVAAVTAQGDTLPSSVATSTTASGSTNSFTVTLPSTQSGQAGWAIYDDTGRIARIPATQTTWVDTTPTFGVGKPAEVNTAVVTPGTQQYDRKMSSKADWAAFYDSESTGIVFGTITDRDNALAYPGAVALTAELDSHPGILKNYWQLFDAQGNQPTTDASKQGGYTQTITAGTVLETTAYSFTYAPLDRVNWHREIANRGQGFKQFAQVYPAA